MKAKRIIITAIAVCCLLPLLGCANQKEYLSSEATVPAETQELKFDNATPNSHNVEVTTSSDEVVATEPTEKTTVDYANGKLGENIYWSISVEGLLEIQGTGEMTDCPWKEHNEYIVEAIVYDGITSVSQYCFYECKNLKKVTLPQSVVKIGQQAFKLCESLEYVDLPDGIEELPKSLFSGCTNLKDVSFPDELEIIQDWAFKDCVSLTELQFPEKLDWIGNNTFEDCTNLSKLHFPQSLRVIGNEAFASCKKLTSVNIPANVDSLSNVFPGCSGLREIYFEGDAPTLYVKIFNGINAKCYYESGNSTWTITKMSDYGGTIEWIGY